MTKGKTFYSLDSVKKIWSNQIKGCFISYFCNNSNGFYFYWQEIKQVSQTALVKFLSGHMYPMMLFP